MLGAAGVSFNGPSHGLPKVLGSVGFICGALLQIICGQRQRLDEELGWHDRTFKERIEEATKGWCEVEAVGMGCYI